MYMRPRAGTGEVLVDASGSMPQTNLYSDCTNKRFLIIPLHLALMADATFAEFDAMCTSAGMSAAPLARARLHAILREN